MPHIPIRHEQLIVLNQAKHRSKPYHIAQNIHSFKQPKWVPVSVVSNPSLRFRPHAAGADSHAIPKTAGLGTWRPAVHAMHAVHAGGSRVGSRRPSANTTSGKLTLSRARRSSVGMDVYLIGGNFSTELWSGWFLFGRVGKGRLRRAKEVKDASGALKAVLYVFLSLLVLTRKHRNHPPPYTFQQKLQSQAPSSSRDPSEMR